MSERNTISDLVNMHSILLYMYDHVNDSDSSVTHLNMSILQILVTTSLMNWLILFIHLLIHMDSLYPINRCHL